MASRKSKTININNIEDWVKTQSISATKTDNGTLNQQIKILQTIKAPAELEGWNIYATSGNENDCMIHSLLIDTSTTFRRLQESERNRIANLYRRTVFSNIPGVDKRRALNSVFLEDPDLQAFGNYYSINILVYTPSRNEFQQVSNRNSGDFILIHYNGSSHYSAMSTKDSFFINLALAGQLVAKYSTPTKTFCEYNTNDFIIKNGDVEAVVQDIYTQDIRNKQTGALQNVCISLDITYLPDSRTEKKVPIEQFLTPAQKAERIRLFGSIAPPPSASSVSPFTPTPLPPKPKLPTSSPLKRGAPIPGLFTPPAPPKPCPIKTGTLGSETGFTETLECVVVAPPAPGAIPSFWNQKIIETIDNLKTTRHTELMKGDANDAIFDNYPEFKTLALDNTGKVIVPTIDEDRVRDYTSSEVEFNQVMKALQDLIVEIKDFKTAFDNDNLETNSQLSILSSMLEYPQNSQLENYFLITEFISDTTLTALYNTLKVSSSKFNLMDLLGRKNVTERNFVALLVLFSRYAKDGILSKNKWNTLYVRIFIEFYNTDNANYGDLSVRIQRVFTDFFKNNSSLLTESFANKLINGEEMYKIYTSSYEEVFLLKQDKDKSSDDDSKRKTSIENSKKEFKERKSQFALTQKLIQQRTQKYLEIPRELNRTTPTSFIFDRYTEEEKKFMIQENSICSEIAELTGKLGKLRVPQMQIPYDFFVKDTNTDDKLASFLEQTGPSISKDIHNERRRQFFEGRGQYLGLSGGVGRKTKRFANFRIRKSTRNNRKTISRKY